MQIFIGVIMFWLHKWRYDLNNYKRIGSGWMKFIARTCTKCHRHEVMDDNMIVLEPVNCEQYENFINLANGKFSGPKIAQKWPKKIEFVPDYDCRHR